MRQILSIETLWPPPLVTLEVQAALQIHLWSNAPRRLMVFGCADASSALTCSSAEDPITALQVEEKHKIRKHPKSGGIGPQ